MTETERRKFLKASLASLAGAAGVSLPGCERYHTACCYAQAEPEPTDANAEKAAHREELTEKLKELAETDPGEEFDPISADCYDVSWDYDDDLN